MTKSLASKQHIPDQLFEDVFLNAPLGIYTLDKDGTITTFNPKMAELAGDDPSEVVGLNVFEMSSYKKSGLDKYFKKGLSGESFEIEVDYVSLIGKKKSIRHYRGVPLEGRGKEGEARLLLLVEDITERKIAERRLEESRRTEKLERERLSTLINSLVDGVIALDENNKVIKYNAAALSLLDKNEDITNFKIDEIINLTDKNGDNVSIKDFIKDTAAPRIFTDWTVNYSDGEKINLYISVATVHQSYQKESIGEGHVLLLRDITKEKTVEAERDEFISVVSHELRTPLAIAEATISTAMLPEAKKHPEKFQSLLKEAHQNVVFLSGIVNDITTLVLADEEAMELPTEEIAPGNLLVELESEFKPKAEAKNLKFKIEKGEDLKKFISSEYRVKEILNNLLDNAIKYTEEGSIALNATMQDKDHIKFDVIDTGIGMSKSDQKHIFERFWRSEDYRTRTHSGTGLGLYLSKRLADRLGAEIKIQSKLNSGSTFSLILPIKVYKNDSG